MTRRSTTIPKRKFLSQNIRALTLAACALPAFWMPGYGAGLLISQNVTLDNGSTVTRLTYDSEGLICILDEGDPTLPACEGVIELPLLAEPIDFIVEPFFEPDGPSLFREIYEPVTLSPNQAFFGWVGTASHHPDLPGYEDWPDGISEEELRTKLWANYEVEINGVAFKGSNIGVKGPSPWDLGPEEPIRTLLTWYDYGQVIRTPGRHSVIYRYTQRKAQGECPDECNEAGIWQIEFTVDIEAEGDGSGTAAQAPAPFSEAVDMGDGWWSSDWFGTFRDQPDDWIFHSEHGFLLVASDAGTEGFWLFDLDLGWLFTGQDFYPFLYEADRQVWLFYERDSVNPRNFLDLEAEVWFTDE